MSDEPKDGGPAFPLAEYVPLGGKPQYELGMSLRDYFAGQALMGLLAAMKSDENFMSAAEAAYAQADSMLKAKES